AGIEDLLWSLTSLGGQSLVGDDPLTLDLTKGTASGFAGCNTYNGPYERSGTSIQIGPLASTRRICPEPPGLMDQEIQFLAELQNAEGLAIDRNGLQLFGSKSPVTLSFHSVVLGTVGFLQSIEPAPGWALTVQLQDVSKADVAAVVIGETVTTDFSSLPVPYTIAFDPTKIDTRFNYAVSARITDSTGTLLFVNTQAYRVITAGNPSIVEVIVEPAN
ncbi:MAG TPA: YbaY family lipoprotein, partial [Anaerolineales bacterium]|nr:YbaY family lipoprotein [Anaerolineales bacterium]